VCVCELRYETIQRKDASLDLPPDFFDLPLIPLKVKAVYPERFDFCHVGRECDACSEYKETEAFLLHFVTCSINPSHPHSLSFPPVGNHYPTLLYLTLILVITASHPTYPLVDHTSTLAQPHRHSL
jgi:hypothetical protein